MGASCGSQVILCNLPVRFDTYIGCAHGCRYCFAQKKQDISKIRRGDSPKSLREFIEGKRNYETHWVDWDIPIHWGGMSDPFQPIELQERLSYECLQIFEETQYPFVVSTKGKLVAHPEYLELLSKCNAVTQISMVCSRYDKLEPGCPSFEERMSIVKEIAPKVKRVIIRIQPYMPEVFQDVMETIPRYADAGVYGIVVEGMKFAKAKPGLVRIGGDSCYPKNELERDFVQIRQEIHRNGMKFYSGENRLRAMGDDMCCCGIDGLPGFKGNDYNLCMIVNGYTPEPTETMKKTATGGCFKSLRQSAGTTERINRQSFYGLMQEELSTKPDYYMRIFGKSDE